MMDKDINDEIENQKFVNELFNKKITLGLPENQGMRDIFQQLDEMDNNIKKTHDNQQKTVSSDMFKSNFKYHNGGTEETSHTKKYKM
jgi:hypothetical protein